MDYKNDFEQPPRQPENGYRGGYSENGQSGNGYQGNGYQGNGYQGNGYGGHQIIVGEQNTSQQSSTFAVVSLVLGILCLVFLCCLYWLSLIMGVIGLVLGIISLVQNRDGKGMAIAGTIINGISILLSILILLLVLMFDFGMESFTGDYMNHTYSQERTYEYESDSDVLPAQLSLGDFIVK